MNKLRVYLDIDDVIFNWGEAYAEAFNTSIPKTWSKSKRMKDRLEMLKKNKKFWLGLPLKNYPDFRPNGFVSARSIPKCWTKKSLEINEIPNYSNVIQVAWGESKVNILKDLNADIFIDDKVETFKECNKNGIFCLLMDAPHNKRIKTDLRIYSLNYNDINDKYKKYKYSRHTR